jgi:hypothetical protein
MENHSFSTLRRAKNLSVFKTRRMARFLHYIFIAGQGGVYVESKMIFAFVSWIKTAGLRQWGRPA